MPLTALKTSRARLLIAIAPVAFARLHYMSMDYKGMDIGSGLQKRTAAMTNPMMTVRWKTVWRALTVMPLRSGSQV